MERIFAVADYAVKSEIESKNGVIGWDEDNHNKLSCIDFNRIKGGGKPFDTSLDWYKKMMNEIQSI